jgi:hypothetical protein
MSSIAQVSDALKRVLTTHAKELERETGFVERSTAQLDGPTFSQTTVFGWMDNAEASYPQIRHVAASLGVSYQFAICRIKNGGLPRFHTITEPVFQQASTDSATHQSDCQMPLEAASTPPCRSRAPFTALGTSPRLERRQRDRP